MTGIIDYIKAYYRVCRLEYAPGEIPAMLTVLFLGSQTISRFFDFVVIEALFAFILLYLSGFIINAITDKEIDKNYDTFKTSIPKSVDILGERTCWILIIGHVSIATALSLHISYIMQSYIPFTLVLLGTFFGLGYSIRPFQFKVRGIWHAIALGSSAFFLPFIFLMYVVAGGISIPLFLFILGFSFVHYGMEFGNQAIDYIEDKASNVRTPPVRWGMIPSMRIAMACIVIGIVAEGFALYELLLIRGSFTFLHPILTTPVAYTILLGIILIGYYIPTKGIWDMLSTLKESETIEEGMPRLKKICNYAKWQTSGILGVAVVAGILFLGVIYGPATQITPDSKDIFNSNENELSFAKDPVREFFEDEDGWHANISISIKNDKYPRDRGSLMVMIQAWVANIPYRAKSEILNTELQSKGYWNFTSQISAHDSDDTSFKVVIMEDRTGLGDYVRVNDPFIIPSRKDLYIFDVNVQFYTGILNDEKANVTVSVYNEGNYKGIGDLEIEVTSYTSMWIFVDQKSAKNNVTLQSNEKWIPSVNVNTFEIDIGEPNFVINLYLNGNYIDDYIVS